MTTLASPAAPGAPKVIVRAVDVNSSGLAPAPTDDIKLSKNGVTMLFAKRLAGACWRVDWNGTNVVPELAGNGGSLQVALAFDVPLGESPEIENPTEAGNWQDNYGKTTSRWIAAAKSANEVYTESQLAYYYPPGQKVASSPRGTIARGSGPLSDVFMKKRVTLGWKFPNVVNYSIDLKWTKDHWFTQVQILALYLARDFKTAYLAKGGRAERHSTGDKHGIVKISPPATSYPLIMAKDDATAVGMYAYQMSPGGRFQAGWMPWYDGNAASTGQMDYGRGLQKVRLTAVTALWHAGDPTNPNARIPKEASFGIALVFGSVAQVAQTIQKLSDGLN